MHPRSLIAISVAVLVLAAPAAIADTCTTTTDDTLIQNAIADAASNGGGTVQLEARVYDICEPIVLQSRIHLAGAGRGATILRTQQWTSATSPLYFFSIVGNGGISNASVTDLTLDQRTNGRVADGISFVADGAGNVPMNILIARNEIIGTPDGSGHQYMIWNYLGRYVKILNNWISGGFGSGPVGIVAEEGIESYGGYDVLVDGNTVTGINGSCYNFGQADNSPNPNSQLIGLRVTNNYGFYCYRGLNLGTGASPAQTAAHTIIQGNVLIYSAQEGISVTVGDGTVLRDLNISGNTVRNVGSVAGGSGVEVAGIRLSLRTGSASFIATSISRNQVDNVVGSPGYGIRLDSFDNTTVLDNAITTISNTGIIAVNSDATEIRGNRIESPGGSGIYASGPANAAMIVDNTIADWGAGSDGIHLEGLTYGIVRGNMFRRTDTMLPLPISIGSGTCGVAVWNNILLYKGSMPSTLVPACP